MKIEVLDGGRLFVNAKHVALLREQGWDSFERIMAAPQGQLRRDFPGRRTSRHELRRADGTIQSVFLKRYYPEYLSGGERLMRRLGLPGGRDEAFAEWNGVATVAALEIPTLEVIARGQDSPHRASVTSSFVMTAELAGAEEGHRFAAKLGGQDRRALLLRVAGLTKRLHAAGLVHKDLYLCHYMVTPRHPEPALHLIDLQRLARPRLFAERWIAKDLAALVYSSLKAGARGADILAAFRVYRGASRLDARHRRLARRVLNRIDWLKTRVPKHDADFEQLK